MSIVTYSRQSFRWYQFAVAGSRVSQFQTSKQPQHISRAYCIDIVKYISDNRGTTVFDCFLPVYTPI